MPRFKKLLLGFGVFVLVLALFVLIVEYSMHRSGSNRLAKQTDGLDAAEPGWRLHDIDAARRAAQPPAESNSAVIVLQLHDRIPKWWNSHRQDEAGVSRHPANRTPNFDQLLWFKLPDAATADLRSAARSQLLRPEILNQPRGFYPLQIAENPFGTLLPHIQKAREVAGVLDYSARLSALEGRSDLALRDIRAMLMVARSIGDEPFLVSQLVRFACSKLAALAAFQTLAWGQPKEGLAELQAELLTEAEFNGLHAGLRGERGVVDRTFEALRDGKMKLNELTGDTHEGVALGGFIGFQIYRGLLPGDHAKSLEFLTAALEASKLPPHERLKALQAIPLPPRPPDDFRYLVTRLIVPAWSKVGEAAIRTRAELLAASVAIACERFRLANGRWPDSLDAIPKDILPQVPLDPYTGEPIRFQKLPDGIAVFCKGGDENPQRLQQRRTDGDPLVDLGLGWKLWNPDQRGLPPLPAAKPDVQIP